MKRILFAAVLALAGVTPLQAREVLLPAGTRLVLATVDELSSKTEQTGDPVRLRLRDDVAIDGIVAIAAGTPAVGQVADARGTGAFGTSGKLAITPLYIQVGGTTVRLAGGQDARGKTGTGTVAGLLVTPLVSGRSARIPAGTALSAIVLRDVRLEFTATPAQP